jgi:hypothetical protein
VAAPLVLAACSGAEEPGPAVGMVTPVQAYSDAPFKLTLGGGAFRPGVAIDPTTSSLALEPNSFVVTLISPAGRIPATSASWLDEKTIQADMPAGVGVGHYDVEVRDPRGKTALVPNAFESLGPDHDAPVVTIDYPSADARVSPRAQLQVHFLANDGLGILGGLTGEAVSESLGVSHTDCAIEKQQHTATCTFVVIAPAALTPVETIRINAAATDTGGNQGTASVSVTVVWVPSAQGLSPTMGPTTGQTPIVVEGTNFVPGVSQILIDGQPIDPAGGVVLNDHQIAGTTLPHPAGNATVVVANGPGKSAAQSFLFIAPPKLRAMSPTSGPDQTPTSVTLVGDNFRAGQTTVQIVDGYGTPQDIQATVVNAYRIDAVIPPGTGVISLVVSDPIAGASELTQAFSYAASGPPTP